MDTTKFVELVSEMRDAQIDYFKKRTHVQLHVAKALERRVDEALLELAKPAVKPAKRGMELIRAERKRQVEKEGFTFEHDDQWTANQLALAARCYWTSGVGPTVLNKPPSYWPFDASWWKPKNFVFDLIRAGALYLAESERLERAREFIEAKIMLRLAEQVALNIDQVNEVV